MMALQVKKKIIEKVKTAKYFAVILNCTPHLSQQEQMSLVLCYVDVTFEEVIVRENFIDFLLVQDKSGQGLLDSLIAALDGLGLHISDCRDQGYNNGTNMKGQKQGLQACILQLNRQAFFTPGGYHKLNLVLGDMTKCSSKAMTFSGVVQ
ncbi:unnamed protein product [Lepidochelys kempii]